MPVPKTTRLVSSPVHGRRRSIHALAWVLPCIAMCGCASVLSSVDPAEAPQDGLTYYLPKKDIVVTLTVGDNNAITVNAEPTPAYADLSRRYRANFGWNAVGKNELNLAVSADGLLTSATFTTTSELSTALQKLGASVATAKRSLEAEPQPACSAKGTYRKVYEPPSATGTPFEGFCRLEVSISRVGVVTTTNGEPPSPSDRPRAGVYYREAQPYRVEVKGPGDLINDFLVFSPSNDAPHFLPISRTLLANNKAELVFDSGMPKSYKQDAGGEVVALFTLPADIISAYFTAVGDVFSKRKTALTNEKDYLRNVQELELQRIKLEICKKAIESGDQAAKKAACAP